MIGVRCVRRCWYAGKMLAAGEIVTVDPLNASALVASGRCALVNPADTERLRTAEAEELRRVLRATGASGTPNDSGSPWVSRPR